MESPCTNGSEYQEVCQSCTRAPGSSLGLGTEVGSFSAELCLGQQVGIKVLRFKSTDSAAPSGICLFPLKPDFFHLFLDLELKPVLYFSRNRLIPL